MARKRADRYRWRTPYTAAGQVTVRAADGTTTVTQPYSSRELRALVERPHGRRRVACCSPTRPCVRCEGTLYVPSTAPAYDHRGRTRPTVPDAACLLQLDAAGT